MTADDFRARLERVYMAITGQDTPRGAQTWFRRVVRDDAGETIHKQTVYRYAAGELPIPPTIVTIVRHLEFAAELLEHERVERAELVNLYPLA